MKLPGAAPLALALALLSGTAGAESLTDIYELALENDAQLKAEEAQYRASLEDEKVALSALLPQVSAGYSYQDSDTETTSPGIIGFDGGGTPIIGDTFDNTKVDVDTYQVSLSQAIFDLPAWFSFQSGKELTRQAEATFAANQQNLIVRVVEAYLAVLRAEDNLAASQAQERAFERQLEQTQQRFEVGLIAITDVYEAQAAYDLGQVTRIRDENALDVARERLSVLTGKRHDNLEVLADAFKPKKPEPMERDAWVEFALENNFNLKAAQYAEEAARQNAKARKLAHAPTVSGTAQYSESETTGSRFQDPAGIFNFPPNQERDFTAFGIEVNLPLYSGGAISANRRRAAQEFIAARENRINLSRNTVTEARSLHLTVLSDVAQVAARKQSIVSSKSALDATQAGYEVGTRNVVDVLNAQNTLFAAQRDYANSRYDYILNMLRLKEQAGLLSPEDVFRLDGFLVAPPPPKATEDSAEG
ncbi:TolC family outer membrane protein [Pseudohaliea rubra]|uniref:Type I secretion outer membrane protein, TolC n=1 Tax=Pseudohaliea rubra DSM 19751 TaxID=1265313 RepID=A0A095XVK5_9GAMM|nr:TolC family outer membrane protein [Pseudohaliea rubra]KGE03716.1 Type I secretion outer membrane protein, TolC precursor [Pseudohaliea rubra DSM 19751]